jgi:hypothetical protein
MLSTNMNDSIGNNLDTTADAGSAGLTLLDQILDFVGDSRLGESGERRIRDRYPINCKMQLTPLGHTGTPLIDRATNIFGKDLSRRGISFSHEGPLSHQRVMISLTLPDVGQFLVEAEITWSRLTLIGLYESGCRLIRKIDPQQFSVRA